MKNLTWRIPVNWTRRAIVEVNAESFEEAVKQAEEMIDATSTTEINRNLAGKTTYVADIPWSYEVDIDACDVYQTPEALERVEEYEQEQEEPSSEEVRKLFNEYVERVRQVERDNKDVISEEELDSLPISETKH